LEAEVLRNFKMNGGKITVNLNGKGE